MYNVRIPTTAVSSADLRHKAAAAAAGGGAVLLLMLCLDGSVEHSAHNARQAAHPTPICHLEQALFRTNEFR